MSEKDYLDALRDELISEEDAMQLGQAKEKISAAMQPTMIEQKPSENLLKLAGQGILSDAMFMFQNKHGIEPMIKPFIPASKKQDKEGNPILSYGLSSFGYDIRVDSEFMVLSLQLTPWQKLYRGVRALIGFPIEDAPIDPKNFDKDRFKRVKIKEGEVFILPPHSVVLAHSTEYFSIPNDCIGICVSKSTYARCGVQTLCTPLEPGWTGYLTLEFHNGTDLPVKMYAGEGALQLIVLRGQKPNVTYQSRQGKYMNQGKEVVTPIV